MGECHGGTCGFLMETAEYFVYFYFFFGARCLQDVSRYYGFLSRTKLLFESVSSFQFCGDFAHCLCVEEEGPS